MSKLDNEMMGEEYIKFVEDDSILNFLNERNRNTE